MKLKFIQYVSPKNAVKPGACWTMKGDCSEDVLHEVEKCFIMEPERNSNSFCGGIILLPKTDTGVVFRRMWSSLSDRKNRRKVVTNGVVFSIADAQSSGINGIWELPYLADDAEENRVLEYSFNPSSRFYPLGFAELEIALKSSQNIFFKIEEKDKVYSLTTTDVPELGTATDRGDKPIKNSPSCPRKGSVKMNIPLLLILSVGLLVVGYGAGAYEAQDKIDKYQDEIGKLKNQIGSLTVPRDINCELEGIRQQITIIEDALKKLQNADEKLLNLKERLRQLKAEINKERKIL